MASVFISYSRQDQDFVRKLYDALNDAGRDAWVDWEGIPPTAEWLNEVYAAIDKADTFVFILSPDSMASEVCGKEVAHAAQNKKRIIPIVCRQVSPAEVKAIEPLAPLAALNWIFMRESDDFKNAFEQLRFALDTDLDYWHLSSDLLVRAKRWQDGAKNANLTLRGPELGAAEQWLTRGADKEPRPTALQLEYIAASRRTANSRQRRLLVGISIALIVTLLLSIFSTIQYRLAQAENGQLLARALAGESSASAASGNVDQAMLLAVEASRRENTYTTRDALSGVLESHLNLDTVLQGARDAQHPGEVGQKVSFSQDGKTLMSFSTQFGALTGQVTLWDMVTKRARNRFTTQCSSRASGQAVLPLTPSSSGNALENAALSPDGQLVATSTGFTCPQPGIDLWNSLTGARVAHLAQVVPVDAAGTEALTFSADGHMLAAESCPTADCVSRFVALWDVSTDRLVQQVPLEGQIEGLALAFSPDGRLLAICASDRVSVWNLASRAATTVFFSGTGVANGAYFSFPPAYSTSAVAFSPDGRTLAIGGTYAVDTGPGDTSEEGFLLDDDLAAPDTYAYNIENGGRIDDMVFSTDGSTLVTAAGSDLQFWDVATATPLGDPLTGHADTVTSVAFSADGRHFASTSNDDKVLLWHQTPGLSLSLSPRGDLVGRSPAAFSPNGQQLATLHQIFTTSESNGEVVVWDVASGQETKRFSDVVPTGDSDGVALAFSPDGKMLATAYGCGEIGLWDMAHGVSAGFLPFPGACTVPWYFATLAFSRDGRYLSEVLPFGGDTSGLGMVWNLATRQPVPWAGADGSQALRLGSQPIALNANALASQSIGLNANALAFSPDSRHVAEAIHGDPNHTMRLWDLATGQSTGVLTGDAAEVESLTYASDGKTLASMDSASTVTLWDLGTGKPDASLVAPPNTFTNYFTGSLSNSKPYGIVYSGDGGRLVASDGRTIVQWDVADRQLYMRPILDPETFFNVTLSPDGRLLAESQLFGAVIVRYATLSGWQAQACLIANRNLTQTEWKGLVSTSEPYHVTCPDLPA
jgi:WD40 repeat protein